MFNSLSLKLCGISTTPRATDYSSRGAWKSSTSLLLLFCLLLPQAPRYIHFPPSLISLYSRAFISHPRTSSFLFSSLQSYLLSHSVMHSISHRPFSSSLLNLLIHAIETELSFYSYSLWYKDIFRWLNHGTDWLQCSITLIFTRYYAISMVNVQKHGITIILYVYKRIW